MISRHYVFVDLVLFTLWFSWSQAFSLSPLILRNLKKYHWKHNELECSYYRQGKKSTNLDFLFYRGEKLFASMDEGLNFDKQLRNIVLYSGSDLRVHDHFG